MAGSIYSTVFGGNLVASALPTYLALNISANVVLGWPLESNITSPAVAEIIDVTATAAGLTIQLSDARQVSTGYCALFNNVGGNAFTVLDAAGNTLMAPAPGAAWQIYLADNSTLAGTWRTFQYGASTSTANAAALAGNGLKAISATLNERIFINPQGSNYTIQVNDRASCVEWTGGAGGTFTTQTSPTLGSDWFCYIKNSGSGVLTLTPGSGTIDGTANKTFNPNDSCIVVCDGTNLFTMGFGQSVASSFNFVTISLAGISGNFTLNGAQLNRISYKFTGALAGNTVVIVPASIQQYWVDNETTGAFTLTISAGGSGATFVVPQATRVILYCDGLNIVNAITSGGIQFADGTAAAPSITFASDTTMGFYKAGADVLGFSTSSTQRGVINASGQWVINAPSSGQALALTGAANSYTLGIIGSSTTGQSLGILLNAGTNTSDFALVLQNRAASANYLTVRGDGLIQMGGAAGTALQVSSAGNVTILAPSSGTPLTVNGTAGGSGYAYFNATVANPITLDVQNFSTAAAASSYIRVLNSTDYIALGIGSTSGSYGPFFTGGPTGEQGFLGVNASIPFSIGTNNIERIRVAAAGNVTVNAPASGNALIVAGASGAAVAIINGAAANSAYITWQAGGSPFADMGGSPAVISGGVSGDWAVSPRSTGSLVLGTNSAARISINATGNVSINAPSSGIPLAVSGGALATAVAQFSGGGTANGNLASGDSGLVSIWTFGRDNVSTGNFVWAFNGTQHGSVTQAGNWTLPAPSSGNTLTVNGLTGAVAGAFAAGGGGQDVVQIRNTSGSSAFGLYVQAGTTSADYAVNIVNNSASATWFRVRGDGAVLGNDGTNLLELGYKDIPVNAAAAGYTLVAADRGKGVQANNASTVTVPNGVFSAGATIVIWIGSGASATIVQGTGVTLLWAGNGAATGNRTLTGAGVCTVYYVSASVAFISGAGLT